MGARRRPRLSLGWRVCPAFSGEAHGFWGASAPLPPRCRRVAEPRVAEAFEPMGGGVGPR